ncbi:MAG: S8 family peptidase [Clostridiales bacterium]|nr:S8 family peptidase [Clostridiales bacterium]
MSENYMDFIWKIDVTPGLPEELPLDACVQYVNRNFSAFYLRRDEVFSSMERIPIGDYAIPFCHTQMDTESLEATRILPIQNQPALSLKGKGVLLGFLDSGISLENAVFRDGNGRTRVIGLWDQTDQSGTPPRGMLYGSAYTKVQIDAWLTEGRQDLPGADENGHGTKVASIAAGSAMQDENFIGAAPEASIAVVKLKQAKSFMRRLQQIPQNSIAYQENDMMLAIRYLDMLAVEADMPLVICIALGSNSGGHTGSTPLGLYLEDFTRRAGRAIVVAGGNEGNQAHHFFGVVPEEPGYLDVELRVGEGEPGFQLNLWGNAPGTFSAEITSPAGERIPRIFPRILERQRFDFVFEDTVLDIQYELTEVISGDERLLISFRNPTPGIWRLRIYSAGNLENSFHIWLPVTGFINEGTYFLRPDPDTTITEPGNVQRVITVAGYDEKTESIWMDSGRGYTRNDHLKPDLAAPAVEVSAIDRFGRSSTLTGTSAAAALGAGACTLLMEWGIVEGNVPTMDCVTIQRFLIRGARRPAAFEFPNRFWGAYGIIVSCKSGCCGVSDDKESKNKCI